MRLSRQEVGAIRDAATAIFGGAFAIRLFGSRASDDARGGDIDLYVEVAPELCTASHEIAFRRELLKRLGDRRVDVILRVRGGGRGAIDKIVAQTGVRL